MSVLSDLHRQLHAALKTPDELTIEESQVTELALELDGMTFDGGNILALDQAIRSGSTRLFGRPLRVRPSAEHLTEPAASEQR